MISESVGQKPGIKWYLRPVAVVIAIFALGPFALPLVWSNPRYDKKTRIVITSIVIAATYLLGIMVVRSIKPLLSYYRQLLGFTHDGIN